MNLLWRAAALTGGYLVWWRVNPGCGGQTRSKLTSVRLALGARIVLLAAKCLRNQEIATQLVVGRVAYCARSRLAGIEQDLPRGAPRVKVDVARLVELTHPEYPRAATHWSTRTIAAVLGVSAASISRHYWRALVRY